MKEISQKDIIEQILKNSEDKYFIFDCDGTIINGDISLLTGWQIVKKSLADIELLHPPLDNAQYQKDLSFQDFYKIKESLIPKLGETGSYEWEVFLQSGLSPEMVREIAVEALAIGIEEKHLYLCPSISELLREVAPRAYVVSGSAKPTVEAIAQRFGIPGERVLSSELDVNDGILQPRFNHRGMVWEDGKKKYLESEGLGSPYFVAGDTVGDWAMMGLATDWKWCVLWDEGRERGLEYRKFLESQHDFMKDIPKESGIYLFVDDEKKNWVFEVK